MKKSILIIISIILTVSSYSQIERKYFHDKKNQHKFSVGILSLSYSYSHKFKPNLNLGTRIQAGYEIKYMLTGTPFKYNWGYGNGPERVYPRGLSLETYKLQFFYRNMISKKFYYDFGPYASFIDSEHEWDNMFNLGIETSIYFLYQPLHLGFRMDGALSFDPYFNTEYRSETVFFVLYFPTFIVGFNF